MTFVKLDKSDYGLYIRFTATLATISSLIGLSDFKGELPAYSVNRVVHYNRVGGLGTWSLGNPLFWATTLLYVHLFQAHQCSDHYNNLFTIIHIKVQHFFKLQNFNLKFPKIANSSRIESIPKCKNPQKLLIPREEFFTTCARGIRLKTLKSPLVLRSKQWAPYQSFISWLPFRKIARALDRETKFVLQISFEV